MESLIGGEIFANPAYNVRPKGPKVAAGAAILFNDRCSHRSTPNNSQHVRWSVALRYQPTSQDPMAQYGAGILARGHEHPERVATLEDWLAERPERASPS